VELKWLITGGCGFIGRNLIARLLSEEGNDIRVVDNLSVGTADDLRTVGEFNLVKLTEDSMDVPNGLELLVSDIKDSVSARKACHGIDIIVHLAANTGVGPSVEDPMADCEANVIGTLNYLEAARLNDVKRFVFASSGAPAGEVEPPIHEEIVPKPVSPYGASKLAGEGYCSSYFRCFGIETVALRFGNVYGPRSAHKSSVVAKFVDTASNTETTVSELADILVEKLAEQGVVKPIITYSEKRQGDVARNYSDTSKAKEVLGWTSGTTLANGLDKTIAYFLEGRR